MSVKTPETKLAEIFQQVRLEKFRELTKLIIMLNTPRKERKPRTTRKEQEGFAA